MGGWILVRRHRGWVAACLAILIGMVSEGAAQTTVTVTRTYSGTVVRLPENTPALDTTVTLRRVGDVRSRMTRGQMSDFNNAESAGTTVTDSLGRYSVSVTVEEVENSFVPTWIEAVTTDGLRGTGAMRPGSNVDFRSPNQTISVEVRPAAVVEGRVIDESGKGVTSVTVALMRIPEPNSDDLTATIILTTVTQSNGLFQFREALKGFRYNLSLAEKDHEPVAMEVEAPSSGTLLTLRRSRAAVAGVLFNHETREPMPGTTLSLVMVSTGSSMAPIFQLSKTLITDKDGAFEVGGLAGGNYRFNLQRKGWRLVPGKGGMEVRANGMEVLSLESGETTFGLELYAYQGVIVEGQVVDAGGKPVAGVEVSTHWQGRQLSDNDGATDVTGENGRFQVRALDGIYRWGTRQMVPLRVSKEGYTLRIPEEQRNSGQTGVQMVLVPDDSTRVSDVVVELDENLMVHGRVVTAAGAPVSDAEVKLFVERGMNYDDGQLKKKTDHRGLFSFEVAPEQTVKALASHSLLGFGESDSVTIDDRSTTMADITLIPNGTVSGIVMDPDDNPVAGANVSISFSVMVGTQGYGEPVQNGPIVSDRNGRFTATQIPAQREVIVMASAKGFAQSMWESVRLNGGDQRTDLKLVLRKPLSISGIVLDGDRKPVANANIWAYSSDGNGNVITGKDGKFELENLPEGTYHVSVSDMQGRHTNKRDIAAGTKDVELILEAPRPRPGVPEPLATRKLKGKVLDSETREPVENIKVRDLLKYSTAEIEISRTSPGEFTATLFHGNRGIRISISAPGYAQLNTDYLSIPEGQEAIERTFELERGRTARGRLVDGAGKPVPDTRIRLLSQGDVWTAQQAPPVATVRSGPDGTFELGNLRSGLHRLDIRPASPLVALLHEFSVKTGTGTMDLGDIILGQGGTIRVKVTQVPGNRPRAGALVSLYRANVPSQTRNEKQTGEDGLAVFEKLSPGDYYVKANAGGRSTTDNPRTIKLEEGKVEEVELKMGGGIVPGRMLRGDKGAEGNVEGVHTETGTRSNAYSGNDGRFKFEGLIPGEYTFRVIGRTNRSERKVSVTEGDNPEIVLQLPTGEVSGTVLDEQGNPVPGVTVQLANSKPATGDDSFLVYSSSTNSDNRGAFRFEGLASGTYGLTARDETIGFALIGGIQLPEDSSKVSGLRVVLKKEGGTLVSVALDIETGWPIPDAWCHLSNDQGRYLHGATRQSDGTMTIENIPPGKYRTEVSSYGYSVESGEVEIRQGETTRLETVLYVAGAVRWSIRPVGGASLEGMQLTLTPDDPNSMEEPRTGRVDSNNQWVVRGLAPGNYTGRITRPGKPDITKAITIIRREVITVESEVGP